MGVCLQQICGTGKSSPGISRMVVGLVSGTKQQGGGRQVRRGTSVRPTGDEGAGKVAMGILFQRWGNRERKKSAGSLPDFPIFPWLIDLLKGQLVFFFPNLHDFISNSSIYQLQECIVV